MCAITEEKFEQYWAKKAANKASDYRGLNANLIKALRKTVTWKGPNGQEQQGVLTWDVFDNFRFMLNVVIQTGMIYTTWNDEVMLLKGGGFVDDKAVGCVVKLMMVVRLTSMCCGGANIALLSLSRGSECWAKCGKY